MEEENNEEQVNEEAGSEQAEAPAETPAAKETPKETPKEAPVDDYVFDERLYDDDGKFNRKGAKIFFDEEKVKTEKYEKRIADMRKMVSTKDEFVKDKEEYFQDFAPPERFMKYFQEDTPDETKKVMTGIQDKLASKYHDLSLNKSQSLGVSNSILEIMAEMGILDTRTDTEKEVDKQTYINDEKKKLGPNAENIITESELFVHSMPWTGKMKNFMLDMVKSQGADAVDVIQQLKSHYGSETGGVPTTISSLQNLPSDSELAEEYPTASPARKEQIHTQRRSAGRTGKLKFY